MHEQIRLLAIIPNSLTGMGICAAIASDPQVDLIQIFPEQLPQIAALYRQHTPCLLLLALPLTSTIVQDFLPALQSVEQAVRVVFVAESYDPACMELLLRLAAGAFVLTSDTPETLCAAVHAVGLGSSWFSAAVTQHFYAERQHANLEEQHKHVLQQLTKREKEVLSLLSLGLSNEQIGKELYLSGRTVRFHVHNIYEKLNFHSRGEVMAWAIQSDMRVQVPLPAIIGKRTTANSGK